MATATKIKSGTRVEFFTTNGRRFTGTLTNTLTPAPRAGRHFRILLDGGAGTKATIFCQGPVGVTVKAI